MEQNKKPEEKKEPVRRTFSEEDDDIMLVNGCPYCGSPLQYDDELGSFFCQEC